MVHFYPASKDEAEAAERGEPQGSQKARLPAQLGYKVPSSPALNFSEPQLLSL